VSIVPTAAGSNHPALTLPTSGSVGWAALPTLTTVNAPGRLRPGATVLLEARHAGGSSLALAVQRYGRGKAAVFTPQDAWRWQLTDKLPEADRSHAAFWDRLLRWTVDGVPEQVELEADPGITAPGEPVELRARVNDSTYLPRDDARVTVRVVPPDAPSYDVALEADLGAPGEYRGRFTPQSAGAHRLDLMAVHGSDTARVEGLVISDPDRGDPGSVERDDGVLGRIAARTGGRSYDLENLASLPDDVLLTRSGVTGRMTSDLWDAPLIFFLFLLLLGLDWGWRRYRGLA
jgi:hypothetical protein